MPKSHITSWKGNYVSYCIDFTLGLEATITRATRSRGAGGPVNFVPRPTIEAGLLTPPFGLLVYRVKAAIPEETDVSIAQIFKSSTPYWMIMLIGMVAIVVFPKIATLLPELMF